jgi:EAL domain-containing protein (putative c-di-GMP-specific phosphodiesterase class I)
MQHITDSLVFYAQKIFNIKSDDFYIEILSRRTPNLDIEPFDIASFFHRLTSQERWDIFASQNRLASKLFESTGIISSINLDNELVQSETLRNKVLDLIQGSNTPTIYEFTETFPMPPPESINPFFEELRKHGIRSALDDFGTGFNGMSLFVDFDFDIVKIDRCLITDIDTRPAKLKILTLVGQMIEALGKDHVIEGVETASQLNKLIDCGFNTFQGFHLHKPQPIEAFFGMIPKYTERIR